MTFHHLCLVPAEGSSPRPPAPHEVLQARHTLPGRDLTTPGTARRLVGAELAGWGIPTESRETLEQITAELTANAVEHAPGDLITVRLAYVPHTVTLTVTTTSGTPARLHARQAAADDEHGRGLAIVEALATGWGCRTAPNPGVWARLDLRPPLRERTRPVAETAHSSTPDHPAPAHPADDTAELEALVAAGGFWRLTPEWWPHRFEPRPASAATLRAVEAALTRLIS